MSELFVIVYETPVYSRPALWQQLLWNSATDVPTVVVPETNTHFLAKYSAPQLFLDRRLFQQRAVDEGTSGIPSTGGEPHFVGRFTQPQLTRPVLSQANDIPATVDNPPHYLARYVDPVYTLNGALWTGGSFDVPIVDVPSYFIARYSQPSLARPIISPNADTVAPIAVVDTPPHFLAKYSPPQIFLDRRLFQQRAVDEGTSGIKSNGGEPHFVGKYYDPIWTLNGALWTGGSFDVPPPTESGANPHFLGRYTATTLLRPIISQPPQDLSTPTHQPETNVHFIGRYTAPSLGRPIVSQPPQDPVQPDTNTHFIPRYSPVAHRLLPSLYRNNATEVIVGFRPFWAIPLNKTTGGSSS